MKHFLSKNGISIVPGVTVANVFQFKDDTGVYFAADVYSDKGEWMEYLGGLITTNEIDLQRQLKTIYNYDHKLSRSLENFAHWYEKISGNKVTKKTLEKIKTKF